MERRTEPELMDEAEQAGAYAGADFEAPHRRFIELFRETFPGEDAAGDVLDLGCGPGDIAIRFARAFPHCRVTGLDGAAAMLRCGRARLAREPDLAGRVELVQGRLPGADLGGRTFAALISNSLLHHLHQPRVLWDAVKRFGRPGAPVFIVDLMRPDSEETARGLTDQYCRGEPDVLRRDFYHSLLAAFTPEEVQAQLAAARLALAVQSVSDRHLMVGGILTETRTRTRTRTNED